MYCYYKGSSIDIDEPSVDGSDGEPLTPEQVMKNETLGVFYS